ncbi:uncharacterized protein BP5553_05076 [Venustampulla echinocandica]|uniref:Uncharacterized protein n=1 Tax=Venustampulla echinocandica TaxID=2656787 RepID=A0A370TQ46_9HELO|nr:uncharacterized protein BP5553_05076 [Venustampulla echinocandica]RDL37643.1 hypothetical protein BP5553_05076 [Venustampulla echinocandica]
MACDRDEKSTDVPMAEVPPASKPPSSSRSRHIAIYTIVFTVCISIYSLLFLLGPHFNPTTTKPSSLNDMSWLEDDWPEEPVEPFDPIKRYSIAYGKVACWQNEGVWIQDLAPVELSSIGVDRFQDTERSLNQTEEDEFCTRLRMCGASFWSLPPRWPEHINWCESIDHCVEPDINVNLTTAFPKSGGVCVLDNTQGWEKFSPRGLGLYNALTMEERCNVIKRLGGKFCESMQACPETAALLGDMEVVNRSLEYD